MEQQQEMEEEKDVDDDEEKGLGSVVAVAKEPLVVKQRSYGILSPAGKQKQELIAGQPPKRPTYVWPNCVLRPALSLLSTNKLASFSSCLSRSLAPQISPFRWRVPSPFRLLGCGFCE